MEFRLGVQPFHSVYSRHVTTRTASTLNVKTPHLRRILCYMLRVILGISIHYFPVQISPTGFCNSDTMFSVR
jgi:hypothetical protein